MKNIKKLTAFILLSALLLLSLFGCSVKEPDTPNDTSPTVTVTGPSDSNETLPPEIPEERLSITADNVRDYVIVRPKTATEELVLESALLRSHICDTVGNINIATAWERDNAVPETAKEIVIGNTNRPATQKIISKLRVGEFAIVYEGERIYIIGFDDAATIEGRCMM